MVCRIYVNKLANFSGVHLRAQEQTQAAVSLSLRSLLDRHSTRYPSVPAVEGRLIVRLCTHSAQCSPHTPTHNSYSYCIVARERKRVAERALPMHSEMFTI